jgi:enoyl-CoA hydratase
MFMSRKNTPHLGRCDDLTLELKEIIMAQAKKPTVRKPKFEAKQIQLSKPIGTRARKEFGSPTIAGALLDRRRFLVSASLLTLPGPVSFPLLGAAAAESRASETHLAEVPLASGATLTVERRGQLALFGINRPQIQNRIDPITFRALARAYYDYDHDPSLRAAVLFGHGEHFSRGIDIDAFKSVLVTHQPWIPAQGAVDPLAKRQPFLSKPLVVAVHGDTWNMADEFLLVADIRVAAANTNFGQDENTHGRFPGGGSTIRFVREAGWANAMRYLLTGDHWTAAEAYRMGTIQEVLPTPDAALQRATELADKIAACGPLGIKTTLASAHLAVDPAEAVALAQLEPQFDALSHTRDFQEGLNAAAEGRQPVYAGR